jgi:hypothetical protein
MHRANVHHVDFDKLQAEYIPPATDSLIRGKEYYWAVDVTDMALSGALPLLCLKSVQSGRTFSEISLEWIISGQT